MGVKWLTLALLASCSIPVGKSAREDCEAINRAAADYYDRCGGAPAHTADCSKVWDGDYPAGFSLDTCLDAYRSAACGSIASVPATCPQGWDKAPWES